MTVDAARSLVCYVLAGFFDAAWVETITNGRAEAERRLRCGANRHVTLIDISGCKIQARDTMERFAAMIDDPRHRGRALAVVVGGSLARAQLARVIDREQVAFFVTVAEAERWLFENAPPDQPDESTLTASAIDANPSRDRQAPSSATIRRGSPGPA